jgi:hypothetical protein
MTTTTDTIITSFTVKPENMPRISTDASKPTYSTLRAFQDAIQDNAMTIPSPQTELGHLALVISPADFFAVNARTAFIVPTDPGLAPTNPAAATRAGATTRAEPYVHSKKPKKPSTRTTKPKRHYVISSLIPYMTPTFVPSKRRSHDTEW